MSHIKSREQQSTEKSSTRQHTQQTLRILGSKYNGMKNKNIPKSCKTLNLVNNLYLSYTSIN